MNDRLPHVLMTNVMALHHCTILEDWLDFLDQTPQRVVLYIGQDPAIAERVHALCAPRDIAVDILATTGPDRVRDEEPALLSRQFEAAGPSLAIVVRLDTLPYRAPGLRWQADAIAAMRQWKSVYATGCQLPFRDDGTTDDPRFMTTTHLSNNFLMIDRDLWLHIQERQRAVSARAGRFVQEFAVETYCKETGGAGLRLVNGPDFRVFHTQEWGPRLMTVRDRFRRGVGIRPFLHGFQEDKIASLNRWYMHPDSMPLRRARIRFGRWRRAVLARWRGH